ncbi:MAG TPA: ACP S-malonyltransferase [Solirubrobacterales bacterium]|nr:ACP S-malonyltransferase [Solirubrobacterales bacterium]
MAADASTASALLFPGQGSQTPGMEATVAARRPDLLELARELVGEDPFSRVGDSTRFAQPAIYCASVALWEAAGRPAGALVAGHSLGELAALVAGGALDAADGLRLAVTRGRLMDEAAAGSPGGMLAALGTGDCDVPRLAAELELTVANENAPGQLVLSGPDEALAEARRRLRAAGLKAIRLPVAGAFHSPAMADAADRFRGELDQVRFRAPRVPVYSSVDAAPFEDPRDGLAAALTRPVRWLLTLRRLREAGAGRFLEVGPGDVLTGLVRRSLDGVGAEALALEAAHA